MHELTRILKNDLFFTQLLFFMASLTTIAYSLKLQLNLPESCLNIRSHFNKVIELGAILFIEISLFP